MDDIDASEEVAPIVIPPRMGPEETAHYNFIEGWNACIDQIEGVQIWKE